MRTHFAQTFEPGDNEVILRLYGTNEACGFEAQVGKGRAVVMAAAYECDVSLFRTVLERLGAAAELTHDYHNHGVFMTSTINPEGERFLHLLNLDGFDKELHLFDNGKKLLDGRRIMLQSKDGVMLPLGVSFGDVQIAYSTAEITKVSAGFLEFRLTQSEDIIALVTERKIILSNDFIVKEEDGRKLVISRKHAKVDDRLMIQFH